MHTPFKTTLLTLTLLLTAIITTLAGGHKAYAKTTLASSAEDSYDIQYLKFNLSLTDTSLYIAGSVSTMALVTAPSMSAYVFELDSAMVIDSAKVDGVLLPVSAVGFVRTISLPAALAGGTFFTAQIFYRGTAPTGTGFFNAVTHSVSTGGTHMVYTVSDPWVAKDWWPAKQSATDKIDSVDMFITVPRGVVDGSNGRLVGVDTTVPGYSTFHWQSHYPIDYYLISVAVARYAEYKSYVHFTGSTDSMLVQNFFLDTATFNPLYKANFDSIGLMIDYYSTLFGRYPFWQEKYGVCYTDLPGGMENQTMTTIGTPTTSVIAHELMHQWFGDHVTYATWGEMWLSEGFATFAEQLYLDHFWGPAAGRAHRQSLLNTALSPVCGEVYVTDTSGPATLFYQPTVYDKGQGIVTMLRYLAPQDSLFFKAMRLYQSAYAYGNASIDNMAAIVGGVYGFSVDSFLHQWIYGKGFPRYTITWDQAGSTVVLRLVQTRSCPAFPVHFNTPVQLQLHSAAADTIVQAYNTLDTELFVFNWAQPMDSLIFNPDVLTLSKLATAIRRDTALHNEVKVPYAGAGNVRVFPNPSRNAWQIDNLPDDTLLTLTDTYGRAIWAGRSTHGVTVIPASALPPGSYYLRISGRENAQSIRLIRW